ncbi:MAG: hypothetical protein HKP51_06035, partial [Sulfitobacter sp.]|nr:hypothetical protein [Sulfitobacter sp.]
MQQIMSASLLPLAPEAAARPTAPQQNATPEGTVSSTGSENALSFAALFAEERVRSEGPTMGEATTTLAPDSITSPDAAEDSLQANQIDVRQATDRKLSLENSKVVDTARPAADVTSSKNFANGNGGIADGRAGDQVRLTDAGRVAIQP